MTDVSPEPVAGACLCGGVRLEVVPPTLFCLHCHCSLCRRNHGAAFVTWFGVPEERFRITEGQELLLAHASSDHGTRSFCRVCGTSLLCVSSHHPGVVDVVLAAMEAPIDRGPDGHIFFADRVGWMAHDESLPKIHAGEEPG